MKGAHSNFIPYMESNSSLLLIIYFLIFIQNEISMILKLPQFFLMAFEVINQLFKEG